MHYGLPELTPGLISSNFINPRDEFWLRQNVFFHHDGTTTRRFNAFGVEGH